MRYRWLSLMAVCAGALTALGQQPSTPQAQQPQPVQLDPVNNKLDAILLNWEKAMSSINTLYTKVTRTATDKVLLGIDTFEGEARYMKPNKASLYLKNTKKAEDFEYLICNGQTAYKYEPTKQEIHIYQLPPAKPGQVSDDNFVSMLFGMKAAEAKRRYDLQLMPPPDGDKFYHYIQVLPREPQDKAEFTRARLVLTINTGLPRQIWFEMPNGNDTTWEFTKLAPNVKLDPRDFEQPVAPKGWQLKKVVQQEQPRVVRPQQ
jgi:TIGR03009 family protein